MLSGAGSLLAVLWFSAGLRYQSTQLEEQRKQFAAQFDHLKETSRRDALLLAKGILEGSEQQAITLNGQITVISELTSAYMDMGELGPLLNSKDPAEVMKAHQRWVKKEGAALLLLNGIKSAAEIYLRSVNVTDIDYSRPADEFYFVYSSRFASQPFFNKYSGTAQILSEIMVRLTPGRNAASIAFFAASIKSTDAKLFKLDRIKADIEAQLATGHPLPEIAKDLKLE